MANDCAVFLQLCGSDFDWASTCRSTEDLSNEQALPLTIGSDQAEGYTCGRKERPLTLPHSVWPGRYLLEGEAGLTNLTLFTTQG